MKRLLFLLSLPIILGAFRIPTLVFAKNFEYLRIISENTRFFSDQSRLDLICNLPYTYYVKVLEDFGDFCHVECYGNLDAPAIDGYVDKSDLFSDDLDKTNPYLYKVIKTSTTAPFYTSIDDLKPSSYIFKDREMTYYGFLEKNNGTIYYFVNYNGKPGYVSEEFIIPFTIENHQNELTFIVKEEMPLPQTPTPSDKNDQTETPIMTEQNVLRMVVILLIIIAGFIAVIASKNPKKRDKIESFDEDYP